MRLAAIVAVLLSAAICYSSRAENESAPPVSEDVYRGTYAIAPDHLVGVSLFDAGDGSKGLLFSDFNTGLVRRMYRVERDRYEIGRGFAVREPVERVIRFLRDASGSSITGLATSGGDGAETIATKRPATVEAVTFRGSDATLAGSLILPAASAPVPAVVLLHGSGALTRTSFGPYPEFFASLGLAVLIYDKRSAGESTGEYLKREEFYPAPFAEDAIAAVRFLQSRADIRHDAIGLWGSSEGGMLTTQVAARVHDVAFIVDSSGFMMPLWQEMLYSREATLRAGGETKDGIAEAVAYQKLLFRAGQGRASAADVEKRHDTLKLRPWLAPLFGESVPSVADLRWRWEHVYRFDPLPAAREVRCPVLGLFGAFDTSTPARETISNLRRALTNVVRHDVTLTLFPNANHALMLVKSAAESEVPSATGQVPELFPTLRDWIRKHVSAPS